MKFFTLALLVFCWSTPALAQADSAIVQQTVTPPAGGAPIVLDGDTLFFIHAQLGPFTAAQRAGAVNEKLRSVMKTTSLEDLDTVRVWESTASSNLVLDSLVLMAVTDDDALLSGTARQELAGQYASALTQQLYLSIERYSAKSLLTSAGIAGGLLVLLLLAFWLMRRIFPKVYALLEGWEGKVFRSIRFRSVEMLSADSLTSAAILFAKGIRLALSLIIIYAFVSYVVTLFPWTRSWNVAPILGGLLFSILVTVAAITIFKGVSATFRALRRRIPTWKGTLIKPIRIKQAELLSEERIVEFTDFFVRGVQFLIVAVLAYLYITLVFGAFEFTRTWASTLFGYVTTPLWKAMVAFVEYLPNLFYIAIIAFITYNVLKLINFVFAEIGRGGISLPGFYQEWAIPTYKIVRFLVLAFAAIVIFPYLPGSDSPFFQGISVFLGILFSLGSSSAIANIVAGVVLTYMRPFKLGDRVKIADTMGDVMEKTLLVTRVRTVKNVDITIPNAMVLGSHIINYSSSSTERGLILHTTVTIGYDVPWKQVHKLLIDAAQATSNILKEPAPFVLQTSLDDFYVSYELNAYTNNPGIMARTYSELHSNIQDKFNEGGVEILSPHYGAMRDGNQVTIPTDYLPKTYEAPSFRISALGALFGKPGKSD